MPNAVGERESALEQVVRAVQASAKYRAMDESFVRRVASVELGKRKDWKEAVKATKNKLHQVGGAYQDPRGMEYRRRLEELERIDARQDPEALRKLCREMMGRHASTRERLPVLDDFYQVALGSLGSIHSVLDLACGLNPLAIPWMPLAPGAEYYACDIYTDQVEFLNAFFEKTGVRGRAETCDLTQGAPDRSAQVALLLKTLPCLEQVDKTIGLRLLDGVQAEHLLVSFPAQSLGGRSKGMSENYSAHFQELLAQRQWEAEKFEFPSEVAFLVEKG